MTATDSVPGSQQTSHAQASEAPTPEMQAFKARLKATWESGDYGVFAQYLEPGALVFLRGLNLKAPERLLDVACGAGQLVIPASREGIDAVGVDIASNLIAQARHRAEAEGLSARFDEGDAEDLPYPDASFEVISSLFGAMFAPRPNLVAAELVRVCTHGGRIVLGNWTPASFIGGMFKVMGRHVPPPTLMPSPMLWGDESVVRERLSSGLRELSVERTPYPFAYPFDPARVVEFFRTFYGPTNRAFAALDDAGQAALRADLEAHWTEHNQATDGTTRLESELLVVRGVRA
ncbi:class I SAM-dependent methyltransferase [Deinococcus sp. QL22]|uniref:class I SAM-dependent methyltransferase n=1 Tax=Deinococcus sp. QL22 TaxID=2939437 RepID=UPI002016D645|nr:class I SAM-dependent methyltransferase [Deinococcus sp. QL22]UQN08682.1 class I SAM-dependent methyltransferase [Deinococcus sp. QL22]